MTATKTRVPLAQAEELAEELMNLLLPGCERLEIAGSIRRKKADIGDIELVAVPALEPITDLFGDVISTDDHLMLLADALIKAGTVGYRLDKNGRRAFGHRYMRLTFKGLGLDLFSVIEPAQFGLIYTIRTGPADFSKRLVTQQRFGGLLPDYWSVHDGALWNERGELVETPEERDVFAAIGLDWIEPEARA